MLICSSLVPDSSTWLLFYFLFFNRKGCQACHFSAPKVLHRSHLFLFSRPADILKDTTRVAAIKDKTRVVIIKDKRHIYKYICRRLRYYGLWRSLHPPRPAISSQDIFVSRWACFFFFFLGFVHIDKALSPDWDSVACRGLGGVGFCITAILLGMTRGLTAGSEQWSCNIILRRQTRKPPNKIKKKERATTCEKTPSFENT